MLPLINLLSRCDIIISMEQSKHKNNFIMQAGILAVAGLVVRIIGILYRSPLTAVIGDEGNGYYGFAYNIYANVLLISSYSIPSAISKVMASKLALKEYRNAQRIFRCALIYVTVVGGLASVLTFVFSEALVVDNAIAVLRIFTPTIFLSGFLGVFRGYFQAHKSMLQTSLSQILEQIINALVSIGAALLFVRGVDLAGGDSTTRAIRGAMGSALGTGMGVLFALLFMMATYFVNRKHLISRVESDKTPVSQTDSYFSIAKTILFIVTPFILSTFIYNCTTAVNQTIYAKIMLHAHALSQEETSTYYGIFSGKSIVLRNVPVALASAMTSAIIPTIAEAWVLKDLKGCRNKISKAIKVTMIISIPCVSGFLFLARPIVQLLFPQKSSLMTASLLLMALSITVVFYGLSTILNGVLQSIGQVHKPVVHAAIALGIQAGLLILLLRFTNLNLYALVIVDIVYSVIMCVLNGISTYRYLKYVQEKKRTFMLPSIAALIMGLICMGVYYGLGIWVSSNVICLTVSILIGAITYFELLVVLKAITEDELLSFPKGKSIVRIAKKMRLLR